MPTGSDTTGVPAVPIKLIINHKSALNTKFTYHCALHIAVAACDMDPVAVAVAVAVVVTCHVVVAELVAAAVAVAALVAA